MGDSTARFSSRIIEYRKNVGERAPFQVEGKLLRMVGLTLEAVGISASVGSQCLVTTQDGRHVVAEVLGFSGDKTFLMPVESPQGLAPGAPIIVSGSSLEAQVGDGLLGRVIDGTGAALDHLGPIVTAETRPLLAAPINPLMRKPIKEPLDVGIQAINALLTIGRGQRVGLFAGSGVGKSVLLGMMTRYTSADVVVLALVGERGREVKEMIENDLGPEGMRRAVVVASPADTPPLLRLHAAMRATAIAEYFRDRGKNVLLLMDSLTRFAQAQREIGLAIGEPPATKGYPPSVFGKLPQLVERAGTAADGSGSITAFYTVFVEGDDEQDPIADASRAILDGHIILSRELANAGNYPAIDISQSISRLMSVVAPVEHQETALRFRNYYTKYQQNKDLINVGAYEAGSDEILDKAIRLMPEFMRFLKQDMYVKKSYDESLMNLNNVISSSIN